MSTDTSQARSDARIFTLSELFAGSDVYSIPRYQRNYAWGKPEIHQLILDLRDAWGSSDADSEHAELSYYTGTLVVERRTTDASFEVIDGQQRLTTLALLFGALKREYQCTLPAGADKGLLLFSLRKAAEARLALLSSSIHEPPPAESGIDIDAAAQAIDQGYKYIADSLRELLPSPEEPQSLQPFADFILRHVRILRVELPTGADPIRYFEIMNSRGEQLEAHEVLKARLLGALGSAEERKQFSRVWNACANMDRYLPEQLSDEKDCDSGDYSSDAPTLKVILDPGHSPHFAQKSNPLRSGEDDSDAADHLDAIVDFPNFLLVALSIFINNRSEGEGQIHIPLDDKKLLDCFGTHLLNPQSQLRIMEFCGTLHRCRQLLDRYVIRRDSRKQGEHWALKRRTAEALLQAIDGDPSGTGNYRRILMLQAAFHVSAPGKSHKHWLNASMHWLFRHTSTQPGRLDVDSHRYLGFLFSLAKAFVFEKYLSRTKRDYEAITLEQEGLCMDNGENFPDGLPDDLLSYHSKPRAFVFNFLDYLLWLRDGNKRYAEGFRFTVRGSVEHVQPQGMHEIDYVMWESELHGFGNLCLISHEQNSSLSRLTPDEKVKYIRDQPGSLKYRLIKEIIEKDPNQRWTPASAKQHREDMKALLWHALLSNAPEDFTMSPPLRYPS